MSSRFARAASAMMALVALLTTMVGCGEDDCSKASDHFSECLGGSTLVAGTKPRCEGQYLCVSACVNSSDCATLQAAFDADPKKAERFLTCQASCASAK